jgi:serine/threonine-protein kinase
VIFIALFTSALVSAGMVVGLSRFAPSVLEPPAEEPTTVEVPTVMHIRRDAAGELLDGRGLRLVVTEERPDAEADEGTIASQDPLGGSRVDRGTAVAVVISSGPPKVIVPDLVGQPLTEARSELEQLGLEVGEVSETGEGEPGSVTGLDPSPGTEVLPGSSVDVTAVPAGVEVPDLARLSKRRAQEALEAAGLALGRTRWRFNDSQPPFIVLEQSPAAGQRVPPGSEVEITLNEE